MPDSGSAGLSRRELLQLLGAALGGVALSSCGTETRAYGTPLPNGFQYYPVFSPGQGLLPDVVELSGGVLINDHSEILFHGRTAAGETGIYELTMDYSGSTAKVVSSRTIVATGQVLEDGRKVGHIGAGDTNRHGNFAVIIGSEFDGQAGSAVGSVPAVYLETGKGGLQRVLGFLDPLPDGTRIGGVLGDLDLHDDNDLLLVAHSVHKTEGARQGVYFLPQCQLANSRRLLHADQLIPSMSGVIQGFGLIDMDDGGFFAVQAYGDRPHTAGSLGAQTVGGPAHGGSLVLSGNVRLPSHPIGVARHSKALGSADAQRVGETVFGPRVGSAGELATVTHLTDPHQILSVNGQQVAETGTSSPGGRPILGISAPVLGGPGLLYYSLLTPAGMELCVSNGLDRRSILASGDRIEGRTVDTILHGYHAEQADEEGRIVAYVEFEDAPPALIIGIPS